MLPYSVTGRTMVLKVAINVSFCLPQVVEVSALRIFMELFVFSLVICICWEKLRLGSRVTPKILGFLTVGMVVLLMVSLSMVFLLLRFWDEESGSGFVWV